MNALIDGGVDIWVSGMASSMMRKIMQNKGIAGIEELREICIWVG